MPRRCARYQAPSPISPPAAIGRSASRKSDDGKALGSCVWHLISLQDPPRPDAKATIAETEKLGLNVKMVTGDDVAIGDQIAKQLGMGDHLLVASDVFKDGATPPLSAATRRSGRARRRLRPRVPAAQIRDRQGAAAARPYRRDDRRRRQRRAGAATGRLRHRGERGDRCRAQRRGPDPDRARPVDHRQRHRRRAADLPAHPELRLLPDRDDARHHAAGGGVDRVLRIPAADRGR